MKTYSVIFTPEADVTTLLQIGLVEKTEDGKVWVPFAEIRTTS